MKYPQDLTWKEVFLRTGNALAATTGKIALSYSCHRYASANPPFITSLQHTTRPNQPGLKQNRAPKIARLGCQLHHTANIYGKTREFILNNLDGGFWRKLHFEFPVYFVF